MSQSVDLLSPPTAPGLPWRWSVTWLLLHRQRRAARPLLYADRVDELRCHVLISYQIPPGAALYWTSQLLASFKLLWDRLLSSWDREQAALAQCKVEQPHDRQRVAVLLLHQQRLESRAVMGYRPRLPISHSPKDLVTLQGLLCFRADCSLAYDRARPQCHLDINRLILVLLFLARI